MFEPIPIVTIPGDEAPDLVAAALNKCNDNFSSLADAVNNVTLAVDLVVGETIAKYQLVYVYNGLYYVATNNTSIQEAVVVGIAQENINSGSSGPIRFGQSIITNSEWSFTAGAQLFLGVNGAITTTTVGALFGIPIGYSLTPTSILFNPQIGFTYSLDAGTL